MLATPVTCLNIALDTKTGRKDPSQSLDTAKTSLQRIQDIYYFFADPQSLTQQSFSPIESIKKITTLLDFDDRNFLLQVIPPQTTITCLQGNKFLFEEAVICLIKNSTEAYQAAETKKVSITIWQKSHHMYISIYDYGQGISWWKQLLSMLPYISFKKDGSGIGLPFAKAVIEKVFNGKLIFTSLAGIRTEVICELPLSH